MSARAGPAAFALLCSAQAHAADAFAEGSAWQAVFGLALVLAAIAAAAWALRRFTQRVSASGGAMRTVSVLAVGPRERVVLVECGDAWIVVGVAPGRVSPLHSMQRPEPTPQTLPADAAARSGPAPFQRWLERASGSRNAA